jgi:hypothetical protein
VAWVNTLLRFAAKQQALDAFSKCFGVAVFTFGAPQVIDL